MSAFIVAAARTLIAPKGGLFKETPLHELAASALRMVAQGRTPDSVILGNALGAGGNPARVGAIAAFGVGMSALTVDTQCCSGMDAIALAADRVTGTDRAASVIAGGMESFSMAPARFRQTSQGLIAYEQAQFAPNPDHDPNVLQAAQQFAIDHCISRKDQEAYAVASHEKALRAFAQDPYARRLTSAICARMAPLVPLGHRHPEHAMTAATMAPQADAAAALLVVNQEALKTVYRHDRLVAIEIVATAQAGGSSIQPALAGVTAAQRLLAPLSSRERAKIACIELMESFSAQAIHNQRILGFSEAQVNRDGGLLARGHPIGASGAILLGNLFYQLQGEPSGSLGLALIPAAGGLGSAMLLRKP